MTPNERNLNAAFRALAASGPQEAPLRVETALLAAFQARRRNRRVARVAGLIAAASIAAGLVGFVVLRTPEVPAPPLRAAHIGVPVLPVAAPAPPLPVRPRRSKRPAREGEEIATRFYALPDADAPFEYGAMVRMELPRSAMRVVGLPVNERRLSEPIQADVLLGQDGLARAVRFIQ